MDVEILDIRETTRSKNMAKRRETILRQARILIAQDGFEALKIRDLAARAGLTVPTIYNLVGSKNEILCVIIDDMLSQLRIIQNQSAAGSIEDSLTKLINNVADHFATNEAFFRAVFIAGDRSGLFEQSSDRQDWANGYFDLDGFRKQALTGIFLCLASDAEPAFRAHLMAQIMDLHRGSIL